MKILVNFKEYPECPKEFPDELLNPEHLHTIHRQTIQRLNERGGLARCEIIGNMKKLGLYQMMELNTGVCIQAINQLIAGPTTEPMHPDEY